MEVTLSGRVMESQCFQTGRSTSFSERQVCDLGSPTSVLTPSPRDSFDQLPAVNRILRGDLAVQRGFWSREENSAGEQWESKLHSLYSRPNTIRAWPDVTAIRCLPSTSKDMMFEYISAPVWKSHRGLPVLASSA